MEKFPDRRGNLGNERQDEEETPSFVSNWRYEFKFYGWNFIRGNDSFRLEFTHTHTHTHTWTCEFNEEIFNSRDKELRFNI
jgi:hypothetical protein